MSYKKSNEKIVNAIQTGYPFVHMVTEDEGKAILGIKEVVQSAINFSGTRYDVITWNISTGFFKEVSVNQSVLELNPPEEKTSLIKEKMAKKQEEMTEQKFKRLFKKINDYDKNAIFVIQDIDLCYEDKDLVVMLKEVIAKISKSIMRDHKKLDRYHNRDNATKMIYGISDKAGIPHNLNKLATLIEYELPSKEELLSVLKIFANEQKVVLGNLYKSEDELMKIAEAGVGLTEFEFTNAVFNSFVKNNGAKIDVMEVSGLKEQIVKKGGIIEFTKTKIKMSDIGGLENLMDWIKKREIAFDEEKRNKRKLKFPKGILMTGIPGCGKSESVKAIASYLKQPLLRLDTGSLMGKYVGDTEENTRKAIGLAESIAPAILWIDEIEKAFPDPRSGNTHEVSTRLMSYFLTWLQEKESEVFVVATANNIDKLPPELLRKGRFSEIFFVDLPKPVEREKIFKIHLNRINVDLPEADIRVISDATEGYSGAEIEAIVQEANFQSAYDDQPLSLKYLLHEKEQTTPLSVFMGDKLKEIHDWAERNQIRKASK